MVVCNCGLLSDLLRWLWKIVSVGIVLGVLGLCSLRVVSVVWRVVLFVGLFVF